MFNLHPVISVRQRSELKKTFFVRVLFPDLLCRLIDQLQMYVNEHSASAVLNTATNHPRVGLREHKRGHGKTRENAHDQAWTHLLSSWGLWAKSIRRPGPRLCDVTGGMQGRC